MTHDDHTPTSEPVTEDRAPDGAGAAFVAAISAGLRRFGSWCGWFRDAAEEAVVDQSNLDEIERSEAALRKRYARAMLDWNRLEDRARAHGIAFSPSAEAHHRAAILDCLDNPEAPTLLAHRHLTWLQPIDDDGYADNSPTHPAARAIYRFKSQRYPTLYPPERNGWSTEQWCEHEKRQYEEWLSKCSPEARAHLETWARRINAERDVGTCTTSWRAPGYHGRRRRPGLEHA